MLFELVRPIGDDWGGDVAPIGGVYNRITDAQRALAVFNSEDVDPLVFIRPLGSGWLNPNEHEDEFWRLVSAETVVKAEDVEGERNSNGGWTLAAHVPRWGYTQTMFCQTLDGALSRRAAVAEFLSYVNG